jgi:hypothetical protein
MDAEVVQVMSSRTGGDIGGRPRWVISCGYQIGEKKKNHRKNRWQFN